MIFSFLHLGKQRWLTHLLLALLSAAGAYAGHLYAPYADANYAFTIGFGYTAIVLIAVSLMIGPFKLLAQRRNALAQHIPKFIALDLHGLARQCKLG